MRFSRLIDLFAGYWNSFHNPGKLTTIKPPPAQRHAAETQAGAHDPGRDKQQGDEQRLNGVQFERGAL